MVLGFYLFSGIFRTDRKKSKADYIRNDRKFQHYKSVFSN